MIKSFLPFVSQRMGIAGNLLQLVLQNRRLQHSLSKLAEQVFDKVSVAFEFIADKMDNKKKRKDS